MKHLTHSCLLLIDLQKGFLDPKWGERNNTGLERSVVELICFFRSCKLPIFHVRHDSLEPDSPLKYGSPGFAFLPCAEPGSGEVIVTKRAHGAFVGTVLEELLRERGVTTPVLAGLTTDHCVSTTQRMAFDLGFNPLLVADATAAFPRKTLNGGWLSAEKVHEAALASLDGEFGVVVGLDQFRLSSERRETVALKNLS